ncbi:MAG: tetratricopeptide repeat protein [Phaeodactylibacter sp.]|nr:tetratricopeptide repeat protein [Phaeodactylibacter sp.]MCB9304164.1 tetratricopeptide repeat protein [Lewinellaceae bacterium]
MDNAQLLSEIKRLIGNAEPAKALEKLLAFLESDASFRHLYQEALQVQAQFKKTQRDESQGLATAEQSKLGYNRTTQQLLQLVDRLERNDLAPLEGSPTAQKRKLAGWVAGVLVLALAGTGIWWFTRPEAGQNGAQQVVGSSCPGFNDSTAFNILLFPFEVLSGPENRPDIAIIRRLDQLKEEYKINCGIGAYNKEKDTPAPFPSTTDQAGEIASNCQAKLVIWGTTEKDPNGPGTIIQTSFKFLTQGKQWELVKLQVEGSEVDTVSTISSITTEGILTQSIEENIKLLFGLVAHEAGNKAVAIDLLEKTEASDSATTLLKGMVLADSYLANDQPEKALASYDSVLARHPNYTLARNNRGILLYKNEKYIEAAEDISVALNKDSTNTGLLELRSEAYFKTEQLDKAKADLSRLKAMPETSRSTNIQQKLKEVDQKIEDQKKIQAAAETNLRANPTNTTALLQIAESSQKLGNHETAIQAAEEALRTNPKNLQAFAQLIIACRNLGDREKLIQSIQRADAAGVKRAELNKLVPFDLNELVPDRRILDRAIIRRQ